MLSMKLGLIGVEGSVDEVESQDSSGSLASFFDPSFPSMFIHVDGVESLEGTSYKNTKEVDLVLELLH